ncbi:hypothetical protein BS50DRAFT_584251 [Corynespora cassiicola Philippines]|uniref:Uncharacterized protein n=1 Tax=Corynespora cassiicola Philippines TaxID=1448308 RepID=A0A2T2NZ02_CORCC|nr:hypothetical protein BS50DRAFT_584251 [Corynespora cassiicola Philippines]
MYRLVSPPDSPYMMRSSPAPAGASIGESHEQVEDDRHVRPRVTKRPSTSRFWVPASSHGGTFHLLQASQARKTTVSRLYKFGDDDIKICDEWSGSEDAYTLERESEDDADMNGNDGQVMSNNQYGYMDGKGEEEVDEFAPVDGLGNDSHSDIPSTPRRLGE